jgi:HEAT repeat protein
VKLGETDSINAIYSALYPSRPEELESAALAAQILGQLRDRSSIDRLIYVAEYRNQAGQHYSAEVRLAAAAALGRLGIVRGGFIADEFWTSENPALRAQCAFAYGEMGTPESVAHLETLLGDADVRVRIAAAYGVLNVVDTLGGPRSHNAVTRQGR